MDRLNGAVAIVTGGAVGIGRAACVRLVKKAPRSRLPTFGKQRATRWPPKSLVREARPPSGGSTSARKRMSNGCSRR
jgi:hypothetical protein